MPRVFSNLRNETNPTIAASFPSTVTPISSALFFGTILSGVAVWFVLAVVRRLKLCPDGRFGRSLISGRKSPKPSSAKLDLLHRTGVAITQLRPLGAAFINGKRIEVIAEGPLIDRGASLEVVAVKGTRVVVREA